MQKVGKGGKLFRFLLAIIWLFSMALGGFFAPYFVDNIDFFKIKALHVEGLETIPPQVVVEEVGSFKNNWLFINERSLLKELNSRTGEAVKEVKIERVFSSRGVELRMTIKERKPLFVVFDGEKRYFFDEEGVAFSSPYLKVSGPIVYAQDVRLVKENFQTMKRLLDSIGPVVEDIYLTRLGTIVYTKQGLKISLPPLFLLEDRLVRRVAQIIKEYNIPMDAEEVELSSENIAVIKLRKER